jgi:hypothetical protein
VILRIVHGRLGDDVLDTVVGAYRRDYLPVAARSEGLERFAIGSRFAADGGYQLAAMTLWTTVEAALAAYDGDLTRPRTLDGQAHGETLTRVDYYEVDAGAAIRRAGSPQHLRITAGSVARGMDADIQHELRRRLPELPAEAVDAFVGRRVLGNDVEIAFVSTWAGVPDGWSLDDPVWPAISERYDKFRIGVYDLFAEGTGAG